MWVQQGLKRHIWSYMGLICAISPDSVHALRAGYAPAIISFRIVLIIFQ